MAVTVQHVNYSLTNTNAVLEKTHAFITRFFRTPVTSISMICSTKLHKVAAFNHISKFIENSTKNNPNSTDSFEVVFF